MESIIFIAPPAAGKGTQSKLVSDAYHIPHISTGDLLRNAINDDSEMSKKIKEIMEQGNLVSDDIILNLLEERLKQDDCNDGYILDGFPRNISQAEAYDEMLDKIGKKLGYVFVLDIDKEICKKRIVGRLSCKKCGRVYNENSLETCPKEKGLCDECHTELSRRSDDNEETFEERYNTYLKETQPLIDYYEKTGRLYHIDSGISSEYTFNEFNRIIGSSK